MAKTKPDGYKEKLTDEELIALIESGVQNSVGDFLNSSELSRDRLKATYEYAGVPLAHLSPQGVSTIVASDTSEVIEAYLAIISELMFENGKLARALPYSSSPTALTGAQQASDAINYCIFKQNEGWKILNTWVKSALLWKTAVIRWDFIEEYDYVFEEYEQINQMALDELLADSEVEIVGDLMLENNFELDNPEAVYIDVRIKRTIDKCRVAIEVVPPEDLRISNDASSVCNADYVGIQKRYTRSEIRKMFPEMCDNIDNWDELGDGFWNTDYTEEVAARKEIAGLEYWQGDQMSDSFPFEANREITVVESWVRVDRDGDGIAELKRIITAGNTILLEEDTDMVPLASICPFEIPHEFFGLSMADMVRPSTLASTAILRGFVENTYLTNFAPKLADPNVVDFSALQNMKPKQLIATNGNPAAAVQSMPPEPISSGTVPLLEFLQGHKEQATGMSKAAQGLNDTLYVSGNSEQKVSAVQSASQKRIQHIVRTFAETGFKRLLTGVYKTIKQNTKKAPIINNGVFNYINMEMLPNEMDIEVNINVGENSNESRLKKLQMISKEILPGLMQANQGFAIKKETPIALAQEAMIAMGADPTKYLKNYEDPQFLEEATNQMQKQNQEQQRKEENARRVEEASILLNEANVRYTQVQADNSIQDNVKQLAVSLDKSYQEWAKLALEASKSGLEIPPHPNFKELFMDSIMGINEFLTTGGKSIEPPNDTQG